MIQNSTVEYSDIDTIVKAYGNRLYRLCFVMLGNKYDAEDVVQDTLMTYIEKNPEFNDEEHQKAWLIKVSTNKCKDLLRSRQRHQQVDLDSIQEISGNSSNSGILEALMELPEKFKLVLFLYYVEQYRIDEIAKIIKKTTSAVKMRLKKGRELLYEKFKKEYM